MRLVYTVFGYVQISADTINKIKIFNACLEHKISYTDVFINDDGGIRLKIKSFDYKAFSRIAIENGIEYAREGFGGLPRYFLANKYRIGLMLGILASVALVTYFSTIIWDVRIIGNETVTTREMEKMLSDYGVSAGRKIRGIDVDKIQNNILIDSDKISYISINLSGNIASVEMRENKEGSTQKSDLGFANVVAKKSGVITDVRAFVGNVITKSGQIVNAGDILISGVYDSNIYGIRCTRASGEVMAKTVEEYFIEIPLIYEKKQYTGVVNCEKSLNFFEKSFNISKKGGKDIYIYDTISR